MDEIQKQNEEILKTDFVRQFFFDRMSSTLNANKQYDTPAEFSTIANADLNGALETIPEEARESVAAVPQAVINSLIEDKAEKETQKQIDEANNRNSVSIYQAKDAAIEANKHDLPFATRTALTTMFLNSLDDEVNQGRMSETLKQEVVLKYAKDITIVDLGKYLSSEDVPSNVKLDMMFSFLSGNTGNEAIDKYSTPTDRLEYLNNALSFVERIDNYKERVKKQEEYARKEFFDSIYSDAIRKITTENVDIYELENMQRYLRTFAKTDDELRRVGEIENIAYPSRTSPLVITQIEEDKRNGLLTEDRLFSYISRGLLVGEDAKKYINEVYYPINKNLSNAIAQAEIDAAKVNYSANPEKFSVWYNNFSARLSNGLMTDSEIQKAAKDSYSPYTETKTEQAKREFTNEERNGISDSNFRIITDNAAREVANRYNVSSTFDLDENGLKEVEKQTRKDFIKHYQKQKSNGKDISIIGEDGEEITDEELIINFWMAQAKKKLEMQKGL